MSISPSLCFFYLVPCRKSSLGYWKGEKTLSLSQGTRRWRREGTKEETSLEVALACGWVGGLVPQRNKQAERKRERDGRRKRERERAIISGRGRRVGGGKDLGQKLGGRWRLKESIGEPGFSAPSPARNCVPLCAPVFCWDSAIGGASHSECDSPVPRKKWYFLRGRKEVEKAIILE